MAKDLLPISPMAEFSSLKRSHDLELSDKNQLRDSELLSEIILMNILTFLPITSLLRFKIVCRRWYEIICKSTFMNLHLNQHKFMYKPSIQSFGDENSYFYDLLSVLSNTIYGPHPQTPCCAVVGYANGIVCFWCNYLVQAYCLFNLRGGDFFFLPEIEVKHRPSGCGDFSVIQSGFHFIPAINDYKLAVITIGEDCAVFVNLYTKNTNSWNEISAILPCFMIQFSVCNFNGKQIMGTGVDVNGVECVVYFDMMSEKFSTLKWLSKEPYFLRRLAVYNQHLVMFVCPDVWNKRFDCWVLVTTDDEEDYSWSKVLSIGPMGSPFEPLGFWANGMIVLGSIKEEGPGQLQLWLYDRGSRSTNMIHVSVGSHICLPCLCQRSIGM